MAEKKLEAVTEKRGILYEVLRIPVNIIFHTVMPVRFHHRERLQQQPPYVMIANHNHALDPVAMAMGVPHEQVVFLGKKELGTNALIRRFLTRMHCILVDRHHVDMDAMRQCMKAIRLKKILLIFPEGTRHHPGQMEQIETGTSLIAMRSGAAIIPVYFASKLKLFRVTHLYVGEAIPYDDLLEKGINAETCEQMNERIRETYRKMIREVSEKTAKK